jgi:hypothetical protein
VVVIADHVNLIAPDAEALRADREGVALPGVSDGVTGTAYGATV